MLDALNVNVHLKGEDLFYVTRGVPLTSVAVTVKTVIRCSLSTGMCSEAGSLLTLRRYWDSARHRESTLGKNPGSPGATGEGGEGQVDREEGAVKNR